MDQTRETETKAFFVSSYLFFPWKLYTKILLCGNVYDMLLSILILFKMTFVFHATAHLPCFKRLNCLFLHSQSNYILLKFLSSSIPVLFICTCVDYLHAYRLLFFTNALSFGRKFLYIIRKPRNSSYICEYVNFLWSKNHDFSVLSPHFYFVSFNVILNLFTSAIFSQRNGSANQEGLITIR